jgi:pentatricopeptide repeat protein
VRHEKHGLMQSIEKGKDVFEKMHQRDVEARNREE